MPSTGMSITVVTSCPAMAGYVLWALDVTGELDCS